MALAKITSAVSKQVAGNVTKTPASAAMSATKTAASAAMSATKAAASAATTSPQHSLYENIRQPHPSVVQMADQQPAAMMAGSYPAATYPNVFYTPQSGTVKFMQPPQPALQPQTQPGTAQFMQPPPQPALQPQTQAVPYEKLLPSDYLALTVVFFILCTIFNPTSIIIGIPALLLSIKAHNEKGTGNYKKAKRFGNIAIYLTLVNIIYTLFIDTLIVGLAISLRCAGTYYYQGRLYYRRC